MSAVEMIKQMPQAFDAEAGADVNAVIQYNISTPMYATIANGTCEVAEGSSDDATVTLTIDDDDLVDLLNGDLDGVTAFMTGKLQVEGDIMFAQTMATIFDRSKV
jgi:putative sterol carrier protein